MKKSIFYSIAASCLLSLSLFSSCTTKMITKSPEEVRTITTRQLGFNKDLIFKSTISLLQSEGFLIDDVNESVGLISANKRLENANANASRILWGFSTDAHTSKVNFYVEELNAELSEVRITVYEGKEKTTNWFRPNEKNKNEGMVYDAEVYNQWFNNLIMEVERRKALMQ